VAYLPRPSAERTAEDIGEIYQITVDELRRAKNPEDRKEVFRRGMIRCYEAGIDAQREVVTEYTHERPTPVPPPPVNDEEATDPGLLPSEKPPPKPLPLGVRKPRDPRKR
jgi:hypothetical protein